MFACMNCVAIKVKKRRIFIKSKKVVTEKKKKSEKFCKKSEKVQKIKSKKVQNFPENPNVFPFSDLSLRTPKCGVLNPSPSAQYILNLQNFSLKYSKKIFGKPGFGGMLEIERY